MAKNRKPKKPDTSNNRKRKMINGDEFPGHAGSLPGISHVDEQWPVLKELFDMIFGKEWKSFSKERYMENHNIVYQLCTANSEESTHNKNRLFELVKSYFDDHINNLLKEGASIESQEHLLKFYADQWHKYKFSIKVTAGILAYLNKIAAQHKGKNGLQGFNSEELGKMRWRDSLLHEFGKRVTKAVLSLIQRERSGERIECYLIKEVINCYMELSCIGSEKQNLITFRQAFEEPFYEQSRDFYKLQSEEFIKNNPFREYIKRVEKILMDEDDRVSRYLVKEIRQPLKEQLEYILIVKHIHKFIEEFQHLLDNHLVDDLTTMYKLVCHQTTALTKIQEFFSMHVKRKGSAAVELLGEEVEPSSYVNSILGIYQKFTPLVRNAFQSDPGFSKALDVALEIVINSNAVTQKSNSQKSPELIAKYCDILLKKEAKFLDDQALEMKLSDIISIFRYVQDKDVFLKFYHKMFGQRIVMELSVNDDAEALMISKLKDTCGFDYTSKLQQIYEDITVSKTTNEKFKESLTKRQLRLPFDDFTVKILRIGAAPFEVKNYTWLIPPELESCVTSFFLFYQNEHKNRRLNWLYHLSKGELHMIGKNNRRYVLLCSTFQMGILLQYNKQTEFTLHQLQAYTNLDLEILSQILETLVKAKILISESNSFEDLDNKISLNLNYNNKKMRLNINIPLKKEAAKEDKKTLKTVVEDRKYVIQAAIVRIMKARKELSHQLLVAQVLAQIERFKPTVQGIKNCITDLIEREYIRRKENSKDIYEYLA